MHHWSQGKLSQANRFDVECVTFGEDERPVRRIRMPLADLIRSLNVTLPTDRVIRVDRPGAI